MSRCVALCLVALLAYGMTVGCTPGRGGAHREVRVVETDIRTRLGPAVRVDYACRCGRVPFHEIGRP